jgi:hypothetical protein
MNEARAPQDTSTLRAIRNMSRKLTENTRVQYNNKLRHFKEYVKRKLPHLYEQDSDEVKLDQINSDHLRDFFGCICKKQSAEAEPTATEDDEEIRYQSYEHVSGYKSAIRYYYKEKRIPVSMEKEQQQTTTSKSIQKYAQQYRITISLMQQFQLQYHRLMH